MSKSAKLLPTPPDTFVHPNAYLIWTDGSFRPPDNAACAFLIFSQRTKEIVEFKRFAHRGMTINQMELLAVSYALDRAGMDHIYIHSDSQYTISALTVWRKAWARRDWLDTKGEPVKNRELIQSIGEKLDRKKFVRFVKCRAHSGDPFNSVVDYVVQDLSRKMRDDPNIPDGLYFKSVV
jgi:ribonuclease HI